MDDFGLTDLDDHRPQRQTREREPVQEGTHEFQIVQVSNENYGFLFALDAGDDGLRYVWHRMDRDREVNKHLLRDLLRSLAISLEEWRGMDPTDLCDRRVRADIYHKVGANGTLWVNVGKFLPIEQLAEEAAEVAQRPARTPAAKVKQASPGIGRDDVPFAWLAPLIVALIGGGA
jgi:hypothetical protein